MTATNQRLLLLFSFLALLCGCAKATAPGYRVISYDAGTGAWVIIYDGTIGGVHVKKRITAVCDFYKWGDHETVTGPQACSLRIGQLLVPNAMPGEGHRGEFLDIFEMSADRLSVTTGEGPDRVNQQFVILKQELVSD